MVTMGVLFGRGFGVLCCKCAEIAGGLELDRHWLADLVRALKWRRLIDTGPVGSERLRWLVTDHLVGPGASGSSISYTT